MAPERTHFSRAAVAQAAATRASGMPSMGTGTPCQLQDALHREAFDNDGSVEHRGARLANGEVRTLLEKAHVRDSVAANVFNEDPSTVPAPRVSLSAHPSFAGAAGMPSDAKGAQLHPELPGMNGEPRQLPGSYAAQNVGMEAELLIAAREAELTTAPPLGAVNGTPCVSQDGSRATLVPSASLQRVLSQELARPGANFSFPWEMEADVPPERPAPPKDYAAAGASISERARYRGVKKVDTVLVRESYDEPGGVLSQAGFPHPAPKRWDDQLFENR